MTKPELKTSFESKQSSRSVTIHHNVSPYSQSTSVEISQQGEVIKGIQIDSKDNIEVAIAVLGVERVTDEVEAKAQALAKWHNYTEEQMLEYAIAYLRAAMIIRERNSVEAKKDLEDAFALYKLCYPKSVIDLEEFSGGERWISNLRKVREDPTVLGTL